MKAQADGVFVVPVNERIARENGQFLINKRKEDLSVNLVLVPTLPRDAWTVGAVQSLLADARGAVGKLLPRYQKPVVWAVTRKLAVAVCSHMQGTRCCCARGRAGRGHAAGQRGIAQPCARDGVLPPFQGRRGIYPGNPAGDTGRGRGVAAVGTAPGRPVARIRPRTIPRG
ncbi:hypothetical protein [Massilia sp. Se16.2.3]|uniref:hypothetical protein n=1 Tax=Massilia sp. Se16.2.3 TaxID=2709303 RepID=UPI0015FEE7FA|nr:hypothetical protein [Massilia sp. Se16.2.3]QNA99283.1 hypothetical protein G4G31_11215 [Massilia sp. Se16.2.3]